MCSRITTVQHCTFVTLNCVKFQKFQTTFSYALHSKFQYFIMLSPPAFYGNFYNFLQCKNSQIYCDFTLNKSVKNLEQHFLMHYFWILEHLILFILQFFYNTFCRIAQFNPLYTCDFTFVWSLNKSFVSVRCNIRRKIHIVFKLHRSIQRKWQWT